MFPRLFVILFLGVVLLETAQSRKCTKWCPKHRYTKEECAFIKYRSCKRSRDCSKGQICCPNGCGCACTYPRTMTERPGTCPMLRMKDCGAKKVCSSDGECPGATKCCANGCICIDPVPKAGECPMFKLVPGLPVICTNDYECPGATEKCCADGRVCFKP